MANNLTGAASLAYQGTNAASPSNVTVHYNAPTPNFYQGFSMGDFWVHRISPTTNDNELWVLMGVSGNVANWVLLTGNMGPLLSLTGNTGGPVFPLAGNINVVGDGVTVEVSGNPSTHTLTISTMGTGTVSSLTTDDGHVVTPTAGTIIVHGTNGITTSGTVGPNTVTITASGALADSFPTDSGTATPSSGVLNIKAGVSTLNSGSSVEFTGSGNTVLLNVTDASGNTIVGKSSGNATLSGTNNTVLGKSSAVGLTTGSTNVVVGEASGAGLTTGAGNILLGYTSGSAFASSESNNIVIGNSPGIVGSSHEIRIGSAVTGGDNNVFIGNKSGSAYVAGGLADNTGIGTNSLHAVTSGFYNTCVGGESGSSIVSANNNVLFGQEAGSKITTGNANTGLGSSVFFSSMGNTGLTSGSQNIAIGYTCCNTYTSSESGNIVIGDTPGVNGESNVLRIGFQGAAGASSITKTLIDGIYGVTTSGAATAVLIDATGNLGTISSSIRYKENVKDMADESSPLMDLRPVTFNYKKHGNKDYGLIAEEVSEIFPDLVIYNDEGEPETVKYHLLCSILLNEVQKLSKRIEKLESKQ